MAYNQPRGGCLPASFRLPSGCRWASPGGSAEEPVSPRTKEAMRQAEMSVEFMMNGRSLPLTIA